jgi:predicted DNA-binding transcriptional regulator AlpA
LEKTDLLNHNEAAAWLRVSPATLYLLNKEGRGPKKIRIGGSVRYREGDLADYVEAQAENTATA